LTPMKVMPVTWFTFGVIVADCIVTVLLVYSGLAYEAAPIRFIDLPLWQSMIIKVIGSAVGLFLIEWFRYKFESAKKTAYRAVTILLIIYSTALLVAWSNWVVQYVSQYV